MTDLPNTDPDQTPDESVDQPETTEAAEVTDPTEGVETADTTGVDDSADDLGAGAFDVPGAGAAGADPADDAGGPDEQPAEGAADHDDKPRKAYLGRPELAPLYAMAGLADLAANAVREIANEQIAAYRARRTKSEPGADAPTAESESTAEANAQFNAFLAKAQQRTQEIFDQAVAQYEQLADRGRVAVGEAIDNAKQQQRSRTSDDTLAGMKPDDVSAAAQKAADKISTAVQTAADRISRATAEAEDSAKDSSASASDSAASDTAASDTADSDSTGSQQS